MSRAEPSRRRERRWAPAFALTVALAAANAVAGCSSVLSQLPQAAGGLPDGVPERPEAPPAFPAVHDMPPKRSDAVLSEAERKKLEADLAAARDKAAKQATEAQAR